MTAYDIIIKPVVTERSMENMESKRYTFKVDTRANKSEIKKAVETIFGVKVKQVNTMNITGKKKRMGANVGKRPDWKKAIVTLTEDSKEIEFLKEHKFEEVHFNTNALRAETAAIYSIAAAQVIMEEKGGCKKN